MPPKRTLRPRKKLAPKMTSVAVAKAKPAKKVAKSAKKSVAKKQPKAAKKTSAAAVDSDRAWRGRFQVSLKSKKSVANAKAKTATDTLAVTVPSDDNLLVFKSALLTSALLSAPEKKALDARVAAHKKTHGDAPVVVKLNWPDRGGGVALLGTYGGASASGAAKKFALSSALSEKQMCNVPGSEALWVGSESALSSIATSAINGEKDLLCIVPNYRGIVRASAKDGSGSGSQKLTFEQK